MNLVSSNRGSLPRQQFDPLACGSVPSADSLRTIPSEEFPAKLPRRKVPFRTAFPAESQKDRLKHLKTIIVECQFWLGQGFVSYFQKDGHPKFRILSPQQSLPPRQVTKNKYITILLCVDSGMLVTWHRRAAPRQENIIGKHGEALGIGIFFRDRPKRQLLI